MGRNTNIGRVLEDKYELVRELGKGGMGAVYEARHRLINRRLAIKLLHAQYAKDASTVERFKREAQTATSIGHEHIVEVTDMGVTDTGELFIVMEFLQGSDLATLLKSIVTVPFKRACHIMIQVLSALEAAHAIGVVHRDLKPANIFLTDHGGVEDYVKLVDFGISKVRQPGDDEGNSLTKTGELLGTPLYMSPEQALGDVNITAQSDIFSCGVILYRMVTGALPFEDNALTAILLKIIQHEPVSPLKLRPDTPRPLVDAIKQALAKNPQERFPDAATFRRAITPFSPETPVVAGLKHTRFFTAGPGHTQATQKTMETGFAARLESTPIDLVSTIKWQRRRQKTLTVSISVAVIVLALAIVYAFGRQAEYDTPRNVIPPSGIIVSPEGGSVPRAETVEVPAAPEPSKTAPQKIGFNVAVTPEHAVVSVDDKPFSAGSVSAQLDADGASHRVRIQASGFEPFEAEYVFDKQINLAINLAPEKTTRSRRDIRAREGSQAHLTSHASSPVETGSPPSTLEEGLTTSPSRAPDKGGPAPVAHGEEVAPENEKSLRPIDMDAPW